MNQLQELLQRYKEACSKNPQRVAINSKALWAVTNELCSEPLTQLFHEWLLAYAAKLIAERQPRLKTAEVPWKADEWGTFHQVLRMLEHATKQAPADKKNCQSLCTALMDFIRQALCDNRWEQALLYASKFLLNRRWYDQRFVAALNSDVDSFILLNEADADNWIAQRSEALPSYAETKALSPISPANPLEEEQEEWPRIRAEIDHIFSEGGTMREAVKVNVRLFLEGKHTLSQKAGEYIRSLGFPPAGDREAEFGVIDALESTFSVEVDQLSTEEKTSDS